MVVEAVPGCDSSSGPGVLVPGIGKCNGVNCCCICAWDGGGGGGGGELAEVDPTEPESLKPCVLLSSGVSKKLRLNSEPASKTTSGVILSGDGALPRLPLRDWSILKTSMMQEEEEEQSVLCTHTRLLLLLLLPFSWLSSLPPLFILLRMRIVRIVCDRWLE